ncbi:MAG: tetratricopeptide repeat protein, partial [Planctomycetota bacterium]
MGEVYEAEQEQPVRRRVALKVIKMGMDTREVVARFESERQALALMDHPGIAHVFEAGATERGQPFFAMEFIEGVPITDYCDSQQLLARERLELFIRVCVAVQHAHQKGILHRDIKPSNVLVTVQDGKPAPKIIDFGLAKATAQSLTERTVFTEMGQLLGTPEYMSPEQVQLSGLDIDTRTDVYSLGVLLYELLVGALPFDSEELRKAGFDGIRRKIREDEPSKPSTRLTTLGKHSSSNAAMKRKTDVVILSRQLRGDLDWIVMKALEKDRTRRYASASEFAADIQRHLTNQPVLAGPPSGMYRARKFIARHKVAVATASVVVFAMLLGIAGTTVGLIKATNAERVARNEATAAQQVSEFLEGLFAVSDPGKARGNTITAREILDSGAQQISRDLEGQPLVQARLMLTMGRVYRRLGLYDEARSLLQQTLTLRHSTLGEASLEVASAQEELAWLHDAIGDYDEALQLYEKALATREAILGPDDASVATVMSSLANLYTQTRQFDKAEPLYESALAIRENALGPDHPDVSNTLNLHANLLEAKGEYEAAKPLYERALTIRENALGSDHPRVAVSLGNLANLHWRLGDIGTAQQLIERALAIQEKTLGDDHPDVGLTLNTMANLRLAQRDYPAAQLVLERALSIQEKNLRRDHPRIADTYYNLACVTALQGERDQALNYLEESVQRGFAKPVIFRDSDLTLL